MARIHAFKPYIFSKHHKSELSRLIAPPYDDIKPAQLGQLKEGHVNNITHLTLPTGIGDEQYSKASRTLKTWMEGEVLSQRSVEALYPYTQRFVHPETGAEITRIGFIAALKLETFDAGIVLPHERTLSGPREDRLKLMGATHANLESIFGMFPDQDKIASELVWNLTTNNDPLLSAIDQSGIRHRVWEVTNRDVISSLISLLDPLQVSIVDGHHRYETALNYRDMWRAAHPEAGADHPVDSIMMYLAPMSDPGLVIMSTHRILHSLDTFDFDHMLEKLSKNFTISPWSSPLEGFDRLSENAERTSFLLMTSTRVVLISLKEGVSPEQLIDSDLPSAIASLDVSLLHDYIFAKMLGISRAAQESQQNLSYAKSREDAITSLADPSNQLVIGMNPTRFDQVEAVAQSGSVMPQKSTYFYPKLASGLLVNSLD
ncbi:MAG: DUF1015 domain-containing protein [Chlorobi bacterium]|nr:DUF1015 domain-containing protein [Chlorobiota bacterium]